MTDVTESAAIYRIKRSYERKKKDQVKPMDKNNLFAKKSSNLIQKTRQRKKANQVGDLKSCMLI